MSRVLKSDDLKIKKQETPVLRSDLALNENVLLKNGNASRVLRTSTNLRETKPVTDEKEGKKIKVVNGSTGTLKNAKLEPNRTQLQAKTTGNTEAKKLIPQESSSVSQQKRIRAKQLSSTLNAKANQKHLSPTTNNAKIDKKTVYRKQNAVLDTPHNVTVCSPTPKKKTYSDKAVNGDKQREDTRNSQLNRKRSRTLAPDEIIILKKESAKISSEANVHFNKENSKKDRTLTIDLKRPVAFEVKFQNQAKSHISHEKIKATDGLDKNDEDVNYSDDFESYESDFETGSSTKSESPNLANFCERNNKNCKESEEVVNQDDFLNHLISDKIEHEDDSQVTQIAVTDIQRDKERKLDSGHYDMNSRKLNGIKSPDTSVQFTPSVTDSLEMFTLGMSEQLDSGISACVTSIPVSDYKNIIEVTYGGYKDFYTKPIVNQRGSDLMTKIQFDFLSFTLVDLKPISYDIFMQTFGKLNTNQNFTQTQANKMNVEQQTEVPDTRSIWTQHPSTFDPEIFRNADKNEVHNERCCGEMVNEGQDKNFVSHCDLETSLDALKQLHNENFKRNYKTNQKQQRRPIDFEHLSSFLLQSSFLIDQILGSSNMNTKNTATQGLDSHESHDRALKRVCEKSFYMDTNILNSLQISKLFANNKFNLLITVHESLPDTNVYSSDFSNLLMVWSTTACKKPLRLLTTWSQVSKVEISNGSLDIIVAALRDGTIALWDLRETNSFCSKLDGSLTHFAATQSIIPSWSGEKDNSKLIMDLGACLDVKCFSIPSNHMLIQTTFPKTQFVSLHDSGIVTVWTLVGTSGMVCDATQKAKYEKLKYSSKFTHTFDYTSPWARVKLTQSAIVNIREHLEKKSQHFQTRFDKTKALFQKNIYSDETLKELGGFASDVGQQGLRFTSLECGSENVFICTNRNYILICSKTLKLDKLKRIIINESQLLFPTALQVLTNEHFLAVGLSNGEVMILNCQFDKISQANQITQKSKCLESTTIDRNSALDDINTTGKSCAIQNILLNVQKSYKGADFKQEYRPSTAACITLIESKKKPFELKILDQQVIFSGSVLRKNLIQSLELSSDGWYLFALANGRIRIYDFYLDQEISNEENQETGNIIDIATGRCGCNENSLMILKPDTDVQVHILNKLASYNNGQ